MGVRVTWFYWVPGQLHCRYACCANIGAVRSSSFLMQDLTAPTLPQQAYRQFKCPCTQYTFTTRACARTHAQARMLAQNARWLIFAQYWTYARTHAHAQHIHTNYTPTHTYSLSHTHTHTCTHTHAHTLCPGVVGRSNSF